MIKQSKGQNLVEYALLVALISVAAILVLVFLGPRIAEVFSTVDTEMEEAAS